MQVKHQGRQSGWTVDCRWKKAGELKVGFHFIDNFNLFWKYTSLYEQDCLHPSIQGSQHLMFNICYAVLFPPA